ncbi:MAG: putative molybdenum carrier protein [Nitrospiraceae bacterium]
MLKKIISGGQTGVDRAALDVARKQGVPSGGWCPRARKAEDGPIALIYPLTETPSDVYAQRTEWNVRDSDATLVLTRGSPSEGTGFTIDVAARLGKPYLLVDLDKPSDPAAIASWLEACQVHVLNVAGPRESKSPGIYQQALRFLGNVFSCAARHRE